MVEPRRTSSSVELNFSDFKAASVVCEALKLEKNQPREDRCKVEVSCRKNVLRLEINATDTAALRAAINSFLRWAAVARDMINV